MASGAVWMGEGTNRLHKAASRDVLGMQSTFVWEQECFFATSVWSIGAFAWDFSSLLGEGKCHHADENPSVGMAAAAERQAESELSARKRLWPQWWQAPGLLGGLGTATPVVLVAAVQGDPEYEACLTDLRARFKRAFRPRKQAAALDDHLRSELTVPTWSNAVLAKVRGLTGPFRFRCAAFWQAVLLSCLSQLQLLCLLGQCQHLGSLTS